MMNQELSPFSQCHSRITG